MNNSSHSTYEAPCAFVEMIFEPSLICLSDPASPQECGTEDFVFDDIQDWN